MNSNFEYLKKEDKYSSFSDACVEAENLMNISYSACATFTRKALEFAVRWVYANDGDLKVPYKDNLDSLIRNYEFKALVEPEMVTLINYVRKLGNKAVHTSKVISRGEAITALRNLFSFTSWIDYCYSLDYEEVSFDESIVGYNDSITKSKIEIQKLNERINKNEKNLPELIEENRTIRSVNIDKRKENQKHRHYKIDEITEAETRKRYIDLNLELSGWEIGKDCLEEVKVNYMGNSSSTGYVDYVLYRDDHTPLAVLEAKKASESPKKGKEQARKYADALEKETGVRPVIFYTNGVDYYIWDDASYPERRVSNVYSKKDLEYIFFRRGNKKSLRDIEINDDITNRPYQKEGIVRVLEAFEEGHRKALLVMATGSGKTRTAASIVDILTKKNWAKNILFLADRTALVKQAKQSFNEHLPQLSLCNLSEGKDDISSRMVFSTYPTMMNAIDEVKKDGKKYFTNGHFDLIIVDESHRSIYKKYQDIFDYFDAPLLGLTATPVDEIDRNTYSIFELEDKNPTFAYELDEAIREGYLVDYGQPKVYDLKLMSEGIRYSDLSEAEKEEFEMTFDDFEDIPSSELNKSLFNQDTVDIVINELMEKGIKVEGGDKLGKTIIFAANQKHADFIVERFDKLYPMYKGVFSSSIYHKISYVDSLIDKFKDKDSFPQIAVSVDMLDTGIDVPEIVNLVFFKKIRSKSKFWQMIGRGTRLCKDLFGTGMDKKEFYIFDYYKNFEFFEINPKGTEGIIQKSLTEKIFNLKIDLIKELEHLNFQNEEYSSYRSKLVRDIREEISKINIENFSANMRIVYINKFSQEESFISLTEKDKNELKNNISPLLISTDNDEFAKRFDNTLYSAQKKVFTNKSLDGEMGRIVDTVKSLMKKGTIVQIRKKQELLNKVKSHEFWEEPTVLELENIRVELRELVRLMDSDSKKIYYTNFSDEITSVREGTAIYEVNDLGNYKEKVEHYLVEYDYVLPVYKLKNNKELTKKDIEYFEKILWRDLGTRDEYTRVYGEMPLLKLVASIIGMERSVAEKEFSKFLNDKSLNSNQMEFVKTIVNYYVENGSMDNEVLQNPPFSNNGGILKLFEGKEDVIKDIISTIKDRNESLSM